MTAFCFAQDEATDISSSVTAGMVVAVVSSIIRICCACGEFAKGAQYKDQAEC